MGEEADYGIDEAFMQKGAGLVQSRHVKTVIERQDEIRQQVREAPALQALQGDVEAMLKAIAAYDAGRARGVSDGAMRVLVFALHYLLLPADLVPDDTPESGYRDDAVVLQAAVDMHGEALQAYR